MSRTFMNVLLWTIMILSAAFASYAQTDYSTNAGDTVVGLTPTGAVGSASSLSPDAYMIYGGTSVGAFQPVQGVVGVRARDVSDVTSSTPRDILDYGYAKFRIPTTNTVYEVKFNGIDSTGSFGGVALAKTMFGNTGIGDSDLPRTVAYIAVFGRADLYKDGELHAGNIPAQILVTPGVWSPITGKVVFESNVDYESRSIMVRLPGPIQGIPGGSLTVDWTRASLDLQGIGGVVMPSSQLMAYMFPGELPTGVVAGEAVQVQNLRVTVTRNGIATNMPYLEQGVVIITATNNTEIPRAIMIRGRNVGGVSFARYTRLLKPAEAFYFQMDLPAGKFTVAEAYQVTRPAGLFWKSNYRTSFSVKPVP